MTRNRIVSGSSVLDNSMLFYGGAIANGNRHNHDNLPVILAGGGGGGGAPAPGRYGKFPSQPMTNLFLTLADHMGATGLERFGDSTGRTGSILSSDVVTIFVQTLDYGGAG